MGVLTRYWAALPAERRQFLLILALGAIVFGVATTAVTVHPLLGYLGGITDEYFTLGAKLRFNGTLGLSAGEPSALRPPGYPFFIAMVLAAFVPNSAALSVASYEAQGNYAVALAQAWLLAGAAICLYLWLAERLSRANAWLAALTFGVNPYSVVMVTLMHYTVLHWLLLMAGGWILTRAVAAGRPRSLAAAGGLWGLGCLVRPVGLTLPIVLLAVLLLARCGWRRSLIATGWVTIGLCATLMPWTVRNMNVTGRFVPVADYFWMTFWGQTVKACDPQPNAYLWYELYERDLMPIYTRVTGGAAYDYVTAVRNNERLQGAFRAEALRHLRRQPQVYWHNCLGNARTLALDINSVVIKAYQYMKTQPRGARIRGDLFRLGHPQDFYAPGLSRAFEVWFAIMTALAWVALAAGLYRRDKALIGAIAIGLCLLFAHVFVLTQFMHYGLKIPFVIAAAFYGLELWSARHPRMGRGLAVILTSSALTMALLLL
ncbi:MAG: hypothetical protein MUF51_06235 [Vicinamibacteria bacterium]|nr:hypothetical protein [Vicinamibacteria bacterium]